MKTLRIISTTLIGYALWLALAFFAISGVAFAQSPQAAIVAKDGKACAAQFQDAVNVNIRPELRATLAPYVSAIRYAENGGKGREYGILHPRVKPTYRSQAGWCAATVQKNYDRWVKAGKRGEFVVFLGNRYCPVGADNDPNGLNKHWIGNVRKFHARFR
jgi:hypothetical protein